MATACAPRIGAARRALAPLNAAAALLLLAAGGMVTSTGSGLAVPDWPLSYGKWMPEMTGGVFYEHGHRMVATGVGFLVLLMAFLTQWEEARPGVRRLAWWTLALTLLQGALGGVTVYYGLPVSVSSAHAVLGQTVFCLLVIMADLVGVNKGVVNKGVRHFVNTDESVLTKCLTPLLTTPLLTPTAAAVAALWLQLVLGAVLRHGGAGIAWHVAGAVPAALAALWAACATLFERREDELRGPAWALAALVGLQLFLGAATAAFRLMPSPRASHPMIATATIHLVTGALLLGTATLLAGRVWRTREPLS